MNKTAQQLSTAHADSLEYPHGLSVGKHIEKNTHAIFDALEDVQDTAIDSVIGNLRGDFRDIRRYVLACLEVDKKVKKSSRFEKHFEGGIEEAMQFMYDKMMAITKYYFSDEDEEEEVCKS